MPFLLVLFSTLVAAEGQEHKAGRVYRLGVLTPGVRPVPSHPTTAGLIPRLLGELGYVEGQNLVIEQRFAEGKLDRLPGLARRKVSSEMRQSASEICDSSS